MENSDTHAIFKVCEKYIACWNNGDAKNLAELFSDEGIRVGVFGEVSEGKKEIEAMYNVIASKALLGSKLEFEKGIIKIISPGIATWKAPFRPVNTPGTEPLNGYIVNILRKENGKWLILESHPKIFPKT